ncbi:molybdopterin-guanine dinucleotide biosynthesis protein A [Dongia sp. agr-C8]
MRRLSRWSVAGSLAFGLLTLGILSGAATAQDNVSFSQEPAEEPSLHEGYYYPKPQTLEHYVSRTITLGESDKVRRQAFIIGMTKQLLDGKYAPSFAIFAKGGQSEKLIIVGMIDGQLNTIYRARALLAQLTAVARATPFFQQNTQPEESTFFDFMKLLGFRQVTITDGRDFAHQVIVD